jgi:predicted HTH domain antitoxin
MTIDIPDSVADILPRDPIRRNRCVLEGLVIGAYTEGSISRGRAFELLGFDHWMGGEFFRRRGVFVNYNLEEFQGDEGVG